MREIDKLSQNIYLSAPSARSTPPLRHSSPKRSRSSKQRRAEFRARRDFLVPALRELGFRMPVVPQGAFYIYADCSALTGDSFAFARELLETAGVAITPGADFGSNAAELTCASLTPIRFQCWPKGFGVSAGIVARKP